ncbi:hypothetical protein [Almyronema epifaneia]|uniref:Uncharacterized protein n=1 Tax=Almyronema epifaneia S1 TaxID=2991925 RepID=A0ABW6IDI2_9CYAN
MRYLATTILAAGMFVTLGFMLQASEPGQWGTWAFLLPFLAWAIAPYLAVIAAIRRFRASFNSLLTLLVAASLLTLSSTALLYDAFVSRPDAQSGLVFLVLPVYQWIGLSLFLIVARRWQRQASSTLG